MTRQDLRDVALDVLADIAPDADLDAVDPTASLQDQFELDSFDFLRFLQGLADRLDVEISERDYRELSTLGAAVDFLEARVSTSA